jgi:hypothetical protein
MAERKNHGDENPGATKMRKTRVKQAHHAKCDAVIEKCTPFSKNRRRGQGCNAAAVVLFCYNYKTYDEHNEANLTKCIQLTATMLSTSYKPFRKMLTEVWNDPEHNVPVAGKRRGKTLLTPWANGSTSLEQRHIDWLRRLLNESLKEGFCPCVSEIVQRLRMSYMLRVQPWTLRRVIRDLDYRYGELHVVGKISDDTEENREQRRFFIVRLNDFMRQELEGTAVLVFMDESYCHTHHAPKSGWYPCKFVKGKGLNKRRRMVEKKNKIVRGAKGKRLVIVHAMTRDGWLRDPDLPRMQSKGKGSYEDQTPIADSEYIFPATDESEDYHKNMNSLRFIFWVQNRLFPAFRKLYPSKKCVLVLDNAGYHHRNEEDYVKALGSYTKAELAETLQRHGISSISCSRKGGKVTIEAAYYTKTQPQGGATNQELYNRLKQWAVEHPDTQESALARVFREESKKDGVEHSLLFTDPYESLEQPIEKAWAHTKNYVADVYDRKNPFSMLHQLVQEGMYGNEGTPRHILHPHGPPNFSKLVQSAVKFSNEFIEKDSVLGGTIGCLSIRPDAQESLRPVSSFSNARSANNQVQPLEPACVMRKPILEDYLFYKELRQVVSAERVDEILANEAGPLSLPLSVALELGDSVLDGSGALIADIEEEKDTDDSDSDDPGDEENPYIGCCRS